MFVSSVVSVQVVVNTPIKFRWLTFLCFKKIQIGIGKPSGYRVAYLQLREPAHLEQNCGYLNDAGMSEAIRGRSALLALKKRVLRAGCTSDCLLQRPARFIKTDRRNARTLTSPQAVCSSQEEWDSIRIDGHSDC